MHPYPFAYHRASSIEDALHLLATHADEGKLLAGGHSLLPVMKLRLAQPGHIIDITGLDELRGVRQLDSAIEIGALTTHHEVGSDPIVREHAGLLAQIAHVVGDQQVRHRGTIGGALAHADPAADYPAGVLTLDAEIIAHGPDGERVIPIADFFVGFLTTSLDPGELITGIRIPAQAGTGFRYEKMANPASGYAIVGVAAIVSTASNGSIDDIRVGITGATDTAFRATSVEDALRGGPGDLETVKAAASKATDGKDVLGDIHAPVEYRTRITQNLTRRAILTALERAVT